MRLMPSPVVTLTSTVPAGRAGAVTVTVLSSTTVTFVPGVGPKLTADAPVRRVPVRVTVTPPATVLLAGDSEASDGQLYMYLLAGTARVVPAGVVTRTLTSPIGRAGATALICVLL